MFFLARLRIHNFFLLKEVDIDFTVVKRNSLIYVEGINYDSTDSKSNWTGKSTLLIDVFRWIFKGRYERLRLVNDVIGIFDKYTMCSVTYHSDSDDVVTLTRYRHHPQYKDHLTLQWNKSDISGERVVESVAMFERALGMDITRFSYGVLFDSNREYNLFAQKITARNKMLGTMWELDEFNLAINVCSEYCSGLDKQLVKINERIKALKAMIKEINSSIKMLEENNANFMSTKEEKLLRLDIKIKDYKTIIKRQHKLTEEKERLYKSRAKDKKNLNILQEKLLKSRELFEKWTQYKALIAKYEEIIKNNNEEISLIEKEISDFLTDNNNGLMCEKCGNIITQKGKMNLIQDKQARIAKMRKRNADMDFNILNVKEAIDLLLKDLKNYNMNFVTAAIHGVSTQLARTEEKISSIMVLIDNASNIPKKLKESIEEKEKLIDTINPYTDKASSKIKLRDEYELELKALFDKKNEIEIVFSTYRFWSGSKGFKMLRNLILTERVQLMSRAFANYLHILTEGSISGEWIINQRNGDIDCKLFDTVDGKYKLYEGFSKAQRSKIEIAQDLAVSLLCAPNIGEIHFDEKFDGMDSVAFSKALHCLRSLVGFNKMILLTSHRDGASGMADAILRIERKDNCATAKLIV